MIMWITFGGVWTLHRAKRNKYNRPRMAHKRGVLNGQDVPKLEGKFNFFIYVF